MILVLPFCTVIHLLTHSQSALKEQLPMVAINHCYHCKIITPMKKWLTSIDEAM
jgi:hypothetical protein